MSKEKGVLAYSGGLDTTAIIPWLKENFDYEVICWTDWKKDLSYQAPLNYT